MTTLERSVALLRDVNNARLRFSGWAGGERVAAAERALELHDEECRTAGQMSLLAYTPAPVHDRPRACEECGARAPAAFATTRPAQWCECSDALSSGIPCPPGKCPNARVHLWLCPRCRDGRLSDDERRQLSIYDAVTRRRSA